MRMVVLAMGLIATGASAQLAPSGSTPPKPVGVIGTPAGTGRWPAVAESRADLPGYTLYRPAALPDTKLPLVVWGNGACRDNGLQHAQFLREIASHGYVVIALGVPRAERPIEPPAAAPPPPIPPAPRNTVDETLASQMSAAIDWAGKGALAHKIDASRVAVMGHSCGGLQTIATATSDARVTTAVAFNSGVYNRPGAATRSNVSVTKADLERLHGPIAYFIGGPTDIAHPNAADDVARITRVPVFMGELPIGHSGTFWSEANGGDWGKVAVAWLDWQLKGDAEASRWFAGENCRLCTDPRWTVTRKGM